MTTYVYETIPQRPKEKPVRFEVQQAMTAPPLKTHPETGAPVRRVITGGYGFISSHAAPPPPPAMCCGAQCGRCEQN